MMLFKVEIPTVDPILGLNWYFSPKLYSEAEAVKATKRAKELGGKLHAVDGANNRCLANFFAGSQAETELEAILKSERKSYREWKLSRNVAQVFH